MPQKGVGAGKARIPWMPLVAAERLERQAAGEGGGLGVGLWGGAGEAGSYLWSPG